MADSSPASQPDMSVDDEIIAEGLIDYTYTFTSIASPESRLTTPGVKIGDIYWRMLIFPKLERGVEQYFSVFLDIDDTNFKLPHNWEAFIVCKVSVLHDDPTKIVSRKFDHCFEGSDINRGFHELIKFHKLVDPANGYMDEQNSVRLQIQVLQVAGRDVDLWGMKAHYDSKEATGMVGLQNQGATCYMNSVLQTLYCTNELRRAVFHMPTEHDDPVKGVALALQRVFYRLQTSKEAPGTAELTRSFGWDLHDSFTQHDVQEFCRVLMENLEDKMKKANQRNVVQELFEGEMRSFIRCTNVDFESSKKETFSDIQLNVKGMKDLMSAFRDYVAVENMDGENKYMAEGHGLQDAKKGLVFTKFPPVLHLQLKRFQFDYEREELYKVNDHFEFPEKLNLDEFLEKPEETPATYTLHSVLVHIGTVYGGHYIANIRPDLQQWLHFDDETVTKVKPEKAINRNFGGLAAGFRSSSSAYMLVYVRDSSAAHVMKALPIEEIPRHLIQRFDQEDEIRRRQEEERANAALYLEIHLYTDEDFKTNEVNELLWVKRHTLTPFKKIKCLKATTVTELTTLVEAETRIPAAKQQLCPLEWRTSRVRRPGDPIDLVASARESVSHAVPNEKTTLAVRRLYVRQKPDNETFPASTETVLIFLKLYDPETSRLRYVGALMADAHCPAADILPRARSLAGLPANCVVCVMEEYKIGDLREMEMSATLYDQQIATGDIIVIQNANPSPSCAVPDMRKHYEMLSLQCDIQLKAFDTEEAVTLSLNWNMLYPQVVEATLQALAAKHPGLEADKIQFYPHHEYYNCAHSIAVSYDPSTTLEQMATYARRRVNTLYYKILDVPIQELESKICMQDVSFFDYTKCELVELQPLLFEQNATFEDLLHEVERVCADRLAPNGTREFRAFSIHKNKIYREFRFTDLLTHHQNFAIRIEEIPPEQLEPARNERIVWFHHIWGSYYRTHGVPFCFLIHDGETLGELRARLQKFLHVGAKEWTKWKVGTMSSSLIFRALEDEAEVLVLGLNDQFALDHVDKSFKRIMPEKAVKILN